MTFYTRSDNYHSHDNYSDWSAIEHKGKRNSCSSFPASQIS